MKEPGKSRIRSRRLEGMRWSVVLILLGASESPGGLIKTVVLGSTSSISASVGLGWGLIIYISNKLPGDDARLGTTL